ncbi:MAG: hypothetical protein JNM22_23310 [Saprospiraceae bacterium]|nr:hypothetical protein [Saprospiraceae bacterium]
MTPDFTEFPDISKETWLQQIRKDLKDKSMEDLSWELSETLAVEPFMHADDFPQPPLPLSTQAHPWEICEDIQVTDPVAANRLALDALEGGAQALCFHLSAGPDMAALTQLLEGIHPDFIGLHFAGEGAVSNPGALLALLAQLAGARGLKTASLHGSVAYNPALYAEMVDWRYLADLLQFVSENFPRFSLVSLRPEASSGPVSDIVSLLRQGNLYLEKLSERGVSPARLAAHLQFDMPIGKSYFYEIAKLRAFKLLWLHILKVWEAPLYLPATAVHFNNEVYTDDLYSNMIRATTMAMSAVIGGADRLTVLPYDAGRETAAQYPPAFGRRIARNVQHLLQLESGLGDIADPAAGSYYVEQLTRQLAAAAWNDFVKS